MTPDPSLWIRHEDRLVPAGAEEEDLARAYPQWPDKGEPKDGWRVSIATAKRRRHPSEPIRIVHAVEAIEPGHELYVMGPKDVRDEHVDGELRGAPGPPASDPFAPDEYDGAVVASPGVDFNYEITTYSFDEPGVHHIQWRPGRWRSNVLEIAVD